MTSSQDSLAPSGPLYSRPSMTSNNSESMLAHQNTSTSSASSRSAEQQKKKGIKSSLGKFFGSKKDKVNKTKESLSAGGAISPLASRNDEVNNREPMQHAPYNMSLNVDPEWGAVPISATPTPTGTPALGQKDLDRRIKRKYDIYFQTAALELK